MAKKELMKCMICEDEFDQYHPREHIYLHHRLKIKDYYDEFLKKSSDGKCKFCDNETTFKNLIDGYRISCKYCSFKVASSTIKDKYNVDNISQLDSIKQKKIDTCLKNHGCKSLLHHDGRTILEEHNMKNFGVRNLSSLKSTKTKIKQTFRFRYGTESALQVNEFKEKYKSTCLNKYGVENPMQDDGVASRARDTCLTRHGVTAPLKSRVFKEKSKETCILKFGVDNHAKTFEARLKSREMLIERIKKETGGKINPMRGKGEKSCFDELEKHIPYKIDRDFTKIGYFPDGFIHELNLVIEFDEPEHQTREWYKKHDKRRDEDFLKIGCRTFRIKQTDWENESKQNKVINAFIAEDNMKDKKNEKKKKKVVVDPSITEKFNAPKSAKVVME